MSSIISAQRVEQEKLSDMLVSMSNKDSERLDRLINKQEQIIDARLGLGVQTPQQAEPVKPIGRNRSWQADYEKKRREDHWRKVIDEQEKTEKAKEVAK